MTMAATSKVVLTRLDVLEQLHNLGYHDVSDEILEEFIGELKTMPDVIFVDFPHNVAALQDSIPLDAGADADEGIGYSGEAKQRSKKFLGPVERYGGEDDGWFTSQMGAPYDIGRQVASKGCCWGVPPCSAKPTMFLRSLIQEKEPPPLKKQDRVESYHAMREEWEKWLFLRRNDYTVGNYSKLLTNMRGSPSLVHSSFRVSEKRPVHDMNSRRSSYVVPTTKRRDELRWEVRKCVADRRPIPASSDISNEERPRRSSLASSDFNSHRQQHHGNLPPLPASLAWLEGVDLSGLSINPLLETESTRQQNQKQRRHTHNADSFVGVAYDDGEYV